MNELELGHHVFYCIYKPWNTQSNCLTFKILKLLLSITLYITKVHSKIFTERIHYIKVFV